MGWMTKIVPQTLGSTQTHKHHTKLRVVFIEKGITSATQEKRGCGVGLEVDRKKKTKNWTLDP